MKKLSLYIFLGLLWCNVGFADDISEYQIEGISIGDSLLDHLSKEEIANEIEANKSAYNYLNDDFGEVYLFSNFDIYILNKDSWILYCTVEIGYLESDCYLP